MRKIDLPEEQGAIRKCKACGRDKPLAEFPRARHASGRTSYERRCFTCRNDYRRQKEQDDLNPDRLRVVNRDVIDAAPDRTPAVRLREELARQREKGRPFDVAWRIAMGVALGPLPAAEVASWRTVFNQTRAAWQDSYRGIPVADLRRGGLRAGRCPGRLNLTVRKARALTL